MDRLLRPKSIAVVGGGTWGRAVIETARKTGFVGDIWAVHPARSEIAGAPAVSSVADLPSAPDAAFVAVNRDATITTIAALADRGAGGAVCFASGFAEALAEDPQGAARQADLVDAAADMPILGPNCYGLVNALDRVALWPDRQGLRPVDTGVAIIAQSSNILLNLTMQTRGLPIAYTIAAGNQAQTGLAQIGSACLADPRVTALGLHIEGISDVAAFEALARAAWQAGKPIVALKVGRSSAAQAVGISHTAAMVGSAVGADALFDRLGIAQVSGLNAFLQCLQIFHHSGALESRSLSLMACSGGEAGLSADLAAERGITCPPLTEPQRDRLRDVLGPRVALANPLDYHTYIWGNGTALTAMMETMAQGDAALSAVILDFPRPECGPVPEWDLVIDRAAEAAAHSGRPMAILASLPDTMSEELAERIAANGLIPLSGIEGALDAIAAAATIRAPSDIPVWPATLDVSVLEMLEEAEAKVLLAKHGLDVPQGGRAASVQEAGQLAQDIGRPVAIKGLGLAHKSEAGLVRLNLCGASDAESAARTMNAQVFLVEEMIEDGIAELLVAIRADPAHGMVLTLGAGGVLAELWADTQSLLLPVVAADIDAALGRLRIAPLLDGYRGRPAVNRAAIIAAVMALQDQAAAFGGRLSELEINPLICTDRRAVVADAIITMGKEAP
ncbi:MAG: acetate--CoA ligase family protein [Pseudomonadota bacterium]